MQVRIVELAVRPAEEEALPTGRVILMDSDAPIFELPVWNKALDTGYIAVSETTFADLIEIIEESERES